MLEKVCYVSQIGNEFLLHPRSHDTLEEKCLIKSKHKTQYFDTDSIFDLREELSKYPNKDLHFYLVLFNERMEEINITSSNIEETNIYDFQRIKSNRLSKSFLYTYNLKKGRNEVISTSKNNLIYLGNYNNDTSKLAWENKGCMYSDYSKKGKGYFGYILNLRNLSEIPKFGLLVAYDQKFEYSDYSIPNSPLLEDDLPSAPPLEY